MTNSQKNKNETNLYNNVESRNIDEKNNTNLYQFLYDSYPIDFDEAFYIESGFNSYSELHLQEVNEMIEIDKFKKQFSFNSSEITTIAMALTHIAGIYYHNYEHVTHYQDELSPRFMNDVHSISDKFGFHIMNPYMFVDDDSFEKYLASEGYKFDEHAVIWYTKDEKVVNQDSKLFIIRDNLLEIINKPVQYLYDYQIESMLEVFNL